MDDTVANSDRKRLQIESSDGTVMELTAEAAKNSGMISSIIQAGNPDEKIPVNVKATVMEKCIEYMDHYTHFTPREIAKPLLPLPLSQLIDPWDARFIGNMESGMIFELILAANYLDISGLLDLCCAKIASEIRGKTVDEIRKTFGIINDFTPEEEAQMRDENLWCDD